MISSPSRMTAALCLLASLTMLGGCRLCCDSGDVGFAAYGGAWERTQRNDGRVGSLFSPAGGIAPDLATKDSVEKPESPYFRGESFSDPTEDMEPPGPLPPAESDEDFQRRLREFQERQIQEIDVIPGDPLPPSIR